jgi:hypothetical protein
MANVFGTAIADSTGQPGQSTRSIAHARTRTTWSRFADAVHADTVDLVIAYFKSSDQIIDIRFYTDGDGTNGAFNLGISSVNYANGGTAFTVVDATLFASAKATGTAILHGSAVASVFAEDSLDDFDRGKTLWALAAIGDASYTEDPGLTFALVADISTTIDAAQEIIFEIEYVAGD